MDIKTKTRIETKVIYELRNVYDENGLFYALGSHFIDFDYDLEDLVVPLLKNPADDNEFDTLLQEAEDVARNQFNCTIKKLQQAYSLVDNALSITLT